MGDAVTNMRVLKPSRKRLQVGDVFTFQMPDDLFRFGRIISLDAVIKPMTGVILVYIYRESREVKGPPDDAVLSPEELLVPPIMTNRLPWSKGYFETVENRDLQPNVLLGQHCFVDEARGLYFDDSSEPLPGPVGPVGTWGLKSFRTVDDAISDAIGVARVPD